MGTSESLPLTSEGKPIGPPPLHPHRHPSKLRNLQVHPPKLRLVATIPPHFGYEYVSVGKMIRDEINKKTNYSRIILENL